MATSDRTARVVTLLNLKGGVGKTHTTWLLASVCQERGKRVLLIDTDTQGNLSSSFLGDGSPTPGVERLLHPGSDSDIHSLIRRSKYDHIDYVPSSAAVAPFDESDQAEWEKSDLHLAFRPAIAAVKNQYDYVLIDCPPRLSLVSFAALCASDAIIIPMEPADWGAQGIMLVTQAVEYVQQHHNADLKLLGYLVSRAKLGRTFQQSYIRQLRDHFGPLAFDTVLKDLALFERAVTDRVPITIYAPRSQAATIARRLFDEVCARLDPAAADVRRLGGKADVRQEARNVVAAGR